MLRKRREAMGASLAEVEAATKIRQKYLAALEADEWSLLPGEVVGRGFLRNYASYLGLDSTELIERRGGVAGRGDVDPLGNDRARGREEFFRLILVKLHEPTSGRNPLVISGPPRRSRPVAKRRRTRFATFPCRTQRPSDKLPL